MTRTRWDGKGTRGQFWREHIAASTSRVQSAAAYCREQGLCLSTYRWWKSELKRRAGKPSGDEMFTELRVEDGTFSASPELEVALRGERIVRVRRGFDAATLAQVVRVLESLGDGGGRGC